MLFAAEMTEGMWVGAIAAVGALAGAVSAALTKYMTAASDSEAKRQKVANEQLTAIVERQEGQIARYLRQDEQKQSVITRQQEMYSECREQAVEMYGYSRLLHSIARRQNAVLAEKGLPVEPIPDLPQLRQSHAEEDDYLVRTSAENTQLNRDCASQISSSIPPSGGKS